MNKQAKVLIDKAEAERCLSLNFNKNRKIKQKHLLYLVNEMKAGRFQPEAGSIVFGVLPNGEMRLVNGQHTCHAIIQSEKSFTMLVRHIDVSSEDALMRLYAIYDTNAPRTASDSIRAFNLEETHGLTDTDQNRLSAIIRHATANMGATRSLYGPAGLNKWPVENMVHWCRELAPTYHEIRKALKGGDHRTNSAISTAPIMAVTIATVYHVPNALSDFWVPLVNGVSSGQHDPIGRCRRYIDYCQNTIETEVDRPHIKSRSIAVCFNAWYEKRELKALHVRRPRAPIRIEGTSFTGTQDFWHYPFVHVDENNDLILE